MKRHIQLISALLAAVMLLALPVLAAEKAPKLPDEVVKLLPPQADILVVVPSLEGLESAWDEMRAMMARVEEDNDMPPFRELLAGMDVPIHEFMDWKKPVTFAVTLPNMMAGVEMQWTGILPWRGNQEDLKALAEGLPSTQVKLERGYLVMSQNLPEDSAGDPTPLVDFLQPGAICAAMDLEKVWSDYEPMLGFAMMGMTMPQTDPETGEPGEPAMTQSEAEALAEGLRTFFGSVDVLTLGADLSQGTMRLVEELHMLPGATLDPLPQPDFQQALDLTRYLDPDADWAMAYSVDPGQFMELYEQIYGGTLADTYAETGLMDEEAAQQMVDTYFEALDMYMTPSAMTVSLDPAQRKYRATAIQRVQGGTDLFAMQKQMIEQITASQEMLSLNLLEPRTLDGVEVQSWEVALNEDALNKMMAQEDGPEAMDAQEMAAMLKTMAQLLPRCSMAQRDGLVFWCLDQDLAPMEQMLVKSRKGKGKVHKGLGDLAREAGDQCQGVFQGDLAKVITLGLEIAHDIVPEKVPALELSSIPVSYLLSVGETSVGVDLRFGLSGMMDFVAAMEKFDEQKTAEAGGESE